MSAVLPKIYTLNLKSSLLRAICKCVFFFKIETYHFFFYLLYLFIYSELDDSEALIQATSNNFSRGYDIIVHRLVDHSELPSEIEFGCVLTIPGTNYEIREKSIYKIRSGRKLLTFLFLNFRIYKHLLEN